MPVRLLNKIEPSLTLMKMTFGFDHPNATIGADIFSRKASRQVQRYGTMVTHGFQYSVFCAFKSFTNNIASNCQNDLCQIPKAPRSKIEV